VSLRARFLEFDDALASRGVPPLTQWWRDGIGAWLDAYEQGQVLELWACVGRGSAKSTALYKLALFFMLFGDFVVPPGERHFAIVLSRLKEEAAKGITIIASWLDLLGVPYRLVGDVIELVDMPRGIRVVAASVAASSGWRAFFIGRDERSKWPTGGVEEMDAEEIDASSTAMTATHPLAPTVTTGSAWGAIGKFYNTITAGSDDGKIVLGPAATWVAAPHVKEADLRRKEKDPKKFAREYLCVFQSGATSALDPDLLRAAGKQTLTRMVALGQVVMANDWSSGQANATAWLCAQWVHEPERVEEEGHWENHPSGLRVFVRRMHPSGNPYTKRIPASRPKLHIFAVGTEERWAQRGITSDAVVRRIANVAHAEGAQTVFADKYNAMPLQADFARNRLAYVPQEWNAETKTDALAVLRQWLGDGDLMIEQTTEGEKLIEELINLREIIRPSGSVAIGARTGNDDRACCLLNIAMAQASLALTGSPLRIDRRIRTGYGAG